MPHLSSPVLACLSAPAGRRFSTVTQKPAEAQQCSGKKRATIIRFYRTPIEKKAPLGKSGETSERLWHGTCTPPCVIRGGVARPWLIFGCSMALQSFPKVARGRRRDIP